MSTNVFNPADRRRYPERWPLYRGKQLFEEIDDRSETGEEELLSVSHITGITPRSQKNVTMFEAESLVGYKRCQVGDIAANTMWTWQGAIGVSQYAGVVSPAYNVYRQRGDFYNPRFLDLLLREPSLVDVYNSLSTGIRKSRLRLYPKDFLTIDFPVPPRNEQDAIVNYLDWKLSDIRKLTILRNKQLGLACELVDKEYALVSESTQSHERLKYLTQLNDNFIEIDQDSYYQKTGMYNRGRGIFRRDPLLGRDMGDSSFQRIQSGCVMISGQFAWEGSAYITTPEDERGVASHRYYLLKPTTSVPAEYIWCFLMSDYGRLQMDLCSHGAAGRNRPLNIRQLMNVYIPIPYENAALDHLVDSVHQLMNLRLNVNKQAINLRELRELRT